ncbi:MAG: glycosyltransferase family 4 protein, partial [Candidatus Hadarchaeota archaeon]
GYMMALFEKASMNIPYTKVIAVSNSTKEKLVASGMPAELIEIVPNGVDLATFDAVDAEKSKKKRIIYVGRLIDYKHLDELITAFSKLKIDAELYLLGVGTERENLENLAKKLGVEAKVKFMGFVDDRKKIELLKSSHVFVLPSTVEGFGIALVEAMAAGVPTLCTNIPALREVTEGGKCGVLFKARDVDDLRKKLEQLLDDNKMREKLSGKGYEVVKEKYTWDTVAEQTEKILAAAASGAKRSPRI